MLYGDFIIRGFCLLGIFFRGLCLRGFCPDTVRGDPFYIIPNYKIFLYQSVLTDYIRKISERDRYILIVEKIKILLNSYRVVTIRAFSCTETSLSDDMQNFQFFERFMF